MVTLTNFHFTTAKAHITRVGGEVVELVDKKGLIPQTDDPFKGNFDLKALRFFFGRMKEIGYWQEELVKKFREDFGDSP